MSLRVWLPLNKDLRNNGASGVTVTNNGATFSNGCANFNGSTSYISCGNPNIDGGKVSAACWVYMNTLNDANYLISLNNAGGYTDQEIGLSVESGYIYFLAGGNMSLVSQNIQINTWTHLAVTFDGNKITGYVNGVSIGSISHTVKLDRSYLTIGARHNGSNAYIYFGNCKIYDARIYDHCLSQKEVSELARGLVAHYKLSDEYVEGTTNLVQKGMILGWGDRWQIVTTYPSPEGIASNSVVYKQIHSNSYFGYGSTFLSNYNTPTSYNGKYLTLSCWYYRPSSSSRELYLAVYGYNGSSYYNNVTTEVSRTNTDKVGVWAYGSVTIKFFDNLSNYSQLTYVKSPEGLYDTLYIADVQIEEKDHATPYVNGTRAQGKVLDYSGMGNDGTPTGQLTIEGNSPRYEKCTVGNPTINCSDITFNNPYTVSFWVYTTVDGTMSSGIVNNIGPLTFYKDHDGVDKYTLSVRNNSNTWYPAILDPAQAKWYHIAVVSGTSSTKIYIDGTLRYTNNVAAYNGLNTLSLLRDKSNKLSDFRIYATALSDTDVYNLYHDSLSINNLQGSHCWEYVEDDTMTDALPVKVNKTGVVKAKKLSEAIVSFYDKETYVEPDGSVWIHLFHHNNPTSYKFNSTDPFTEKVYLDDNRWFDMSVCNYVNKWEIMVKQKSTSSSNEFKCRWIQNANPMTATYDQVKPTSVTRITTDGYYNYTSRGGFHVLNSSAYMVQTDSANGDWWGALGAWNAYNGGIPGFAGEVCSTGYMDVYIRIDNLDDITLARLGKEGFISDQLNEI